MELQKIRTVELDGKVIKLQIVRDFNVVNVVKFVAISVKPEVVWRYIVLLCSGTLLDRRDSEPLQAATTGARMESL